MIMSMVCVVWWGYKRDCQLAFFYCPFKIKMKRHSKHPPRPLSLLVSFLLPAVTPSLLCCFSFWWVYFKHLVQISYYHRQFLWNEMSKIDTPFIPKNTFNIGQVLWVFYFEFEFRGALICDVLDWASSILFWIFNIAGQVWFKLFSLESSFDLSFD